jgi:hypothetical protein
MATIIQRFVDGTSVEFDRGKFDAWCVYVTEPGGKRHAPTDASYFQTLRNLHRRHPRIYEDYVRIFGVTGNLLTPAVLADIDTISKSYPPDDQREVALVLTIVYAAMIAEENRQHAPLKKRIKHLGIYQVLKENMDVQAAANFSKGKKWRDLDQLCRDRGF